MNDNRLFDWPTVLRHTFWGATPFVIAVILYEKFLGEWTLGAAIVVLAAILPFVAVGWLAWQHWKHHRKRIVPPDHG